MGARDRREYGASLEARLPAEPTLSISTSEVESDFYSEYHMDLVDAPRRSPIRTATALLFRDRRRFGASLEARPPAEPTLSISTSEVESDFNSEYHVDLVDAPRLSPMTSSIFSSASLS